MEFVKCSLAYKSGADISKILKKRKKLYMRAVSYCKAKEIFNLKKALSVSYISKAYPHTFTTDGIIFSTKSKPKYWCPINTIDIMGKLKDEGKDPLENVEDIRSFFCKSKVEFLKKFPSAENAKNKYMSSFMEYPPRRIERYTEILFDKDIEIKIKGLFYFERKKHPLSFDTDMYELLAPIKKEVIGLPVFDRAIDYFTKKKPKDYVKAAYFETG